MHFSLQNLPMAAPFISPQTRQSGGQQGLNTHVCTTMMSSCVRLAQTLH
jgi:hypothetical protein